MIHEITLSPEKQEKCLSESNVKSFGSVSLKESPIYILVLEDVLRFIVREVGIVVISEVREIARIGKIDGFTDKGEDTTV